MNPMLICDFYKLSHRAMYPKGTEVVYSTWTPRASRMKGVDKVVFFGLQSFIQKVLVQFFDDNFFLRDIDDIIEDYKRTVTMTLGIIDPETDHISALHKLNYLPISIKALPEGTLVPLRVPMFTIENTHSEFFWLTNFLETFISTQMWQPSTSATIAYEYKKILNSYAKLTIGNTDFVKFQGHDFSMRGMSSLDSGVLSGMGHLTSFVGTDTIPAIPALENSYRADIDIELVGTSIPATEHSIQCAYGDDMEYITKIITEVHPHGFVSVVSDGYDFWNVIGKILPALRDKIMARDGRVVIRPDSGDPVSIICGDPNGATELEQKGAVEALWDIFGGTRSEQGYKILDSHIGLIYGDAITLNRTKEIMERLVAKGFASINVVLGIGSYTYQYNTRDTFGFAMKSTLCVIDGVEKQIFKDPKTDNGIKKSQKGRVVVLKDGNSIKAVDGFSLKDNVQRDLLVEVFRDGKYSHAESLLEIRKRLDDNL